MIRKLYILLIFILFLTEPIQASMADFGTHTGRFCSNCHPNKGDCEGCHSAEGWSPYVGPHVKPSICGRCHGEDFTKSDVHSIHGKKICNTCHSSEGWNSSIAKIPPGKSGDSMVIPKSKECSSCHSINNDKRLHGIHKPFLTEENCAKCHGERSPTREEILRVTGKEPRASNNVSLGGLNVILNPEIKEAVLAPVKILTDFFNSIAKAWMDILKI